MICDCCLKHFHCYKTFIKNELIESNGKIRNGSKTLYKGPQVLNCIIYIFNAAALDCVHLRKLAWVQT